jgi:hypothetical protein
VQTGNRRELEGRDGLRAGGSVSAVPIHRHTGTMMSAGGPFWILPLVFLSLPTLSLAKEGFDVKLAPLYSILGGLGLVSLAWVMAARFQAVEFYDDHFVHRKCGFQRIVRYADLTRAYSELKSASQSYHASIVPRQGATLWPTPRTMHVVLASGAEVELVEMTDHSLLERRLNDFAESFSGQVAS